MIHEDDAVSTVDAGGGPAGRLTAMCLAVSMMVMKNTRTIAKALGRLGGRARAKRLSAAERRRIAALGGAARKRSIDVARRVAENFAYAAAIEELRGPRTAATRISTCRGPLPGLYPDRK